MDPLVCVVLFVVCLIVFFWGLFYWWPHRRNWEFIKKIPGPQGYPLIGNSLLFMGKLSGLIPRGLQLFEEYGPIVRVWIGPGLVIGLKDPDDIRHILGDSKIINRDWRGSKAMEPFLGNGLLTLRGDRWKIHRKLINQTFHFKILECYVEVFGRKSKILMEKLKEVEGQTFDVCDILSLCALDSICETAIGTAVNSLTDGNNDFVRSIYASIKLMHRRVFRPWLLIDWIYAHSSDGRKAKQIIKTVHAFSETAIAQKLDEYRRGVRSPGITTASNKKVSSFLDMLIEASETQESVLSPEEIRDEVTTMAASGLETTAATMSFFLILMALHPEVEANIHQELDHVFGSDSRPATSEDMQQLPFMERCIKETLRLFPIIPFLVREINMDVNLSSGYTIPADSTVVIFSYATHRDVRYFPEPLKFQPDRWLPGNVKDLHPYAYIPFSSGSRNCVGYKYAQLQMKSILSQVLRCYRVTTPLTMSDLQRLKTGITIGLDKPVGKRYCIKLHTR